MLVLLTTSLVSPYPPPTQAPDWPAWPIYVALNLSQDEVPPTRLFKVISIPDTVTPLNKLSGTLNGYENLPVDWDGYGGLPPKGETVNDASEFLSLLPKETPLPKPMLSGNGNIGLYWKADDLYLDIEFEGNGTFSYYAEEAGTAPKFDDMIKIGAGMISEELAQLLFTLS